MLCAEAGILVKLFMDVLCYVLECFPFKRAESDFDYIPGHRATPIMSDSADDSFNCGWFFLFWQKELKINKNPWSEIQPRGQCDSDTGATYVFT